MSDFSGDLFQEDRCSLYKVHGIAMDKYLRLKREIEQEYKAVEYFFSSPVLIKSAKNSYVEQQKGKQKILFDLVILIDNLEKIEEGIPRCE